MCVVVWKVIYLLSFFFFFQAEDGIRDYKVTGVQTCALPIYHAGTRRILRTRFSDGRIALDEQRDGRGVAVRRLQGETDGAHVGGQCNIGMQEIGRASCRERV